jgi:16S rRNA G966 N2-methylase RsmD
VFDIRPTDPLDLQLKSVCIEAFRPILLDPAVRIIDVDVTPLSVERVDSQKAATCYVVRVRTNNATLLRGDSQLFKGSYKERVEGLLDFLIKRYDANAWVHLEIMGPAPSSVERMIPIGTLISAGKITHDSPLASIASVYQIPRALLRGRHLVGPSPAVANLCEIIARRRHPPESILDLFAGTGIATKVFCQLAEPKQAIVVECDKAKIRHLRTYLREPCIRFWAADARSVNLPRTDFDLVVADPYYEDVLDFLSVQLRWIIRRAKLFLLVTGGVENLQWNKLVARVLQRAGLRPKRHSIFGQTILEVRIRS